MRTLFELSGTVGILAGAILGAILGWIGMAFIRRRTSEKALREVYRSAGTLFLMIVGMILALAGALFLLLQIRALESAPHIIFGLALFISALGMASLTVMSILLTVEDPTGRPPDRTGRVLLPRPSIQRGADAGGNADVDRPF